MGAFDNLNAVLLILVAGVPVVLMWSVYIGMHRRGKLRFRLRTMFVATAVLCVLLSVARQFKTDLLEIIAVTAFSLLAVPVGWLFYVLSRFIFDEMANLYGRPGRRSPRRQTNKESVQPPPDDPDSHVTK